jgi:uncharacterized RDD family membrane protein YckC
MSEYQFTSLPNYANNEGQSENLKPKATPGHRLGGAVLSAALMLISIITLFLGYIIWAMVAWGKGQTPAKQILKMRVYSVDTGKPATWGHMAIRQILIPIAFSCVYIPFVVVAMSAAVDYTDAISSSIFGIGTIFTWALQITDAFWILKGKDRQRLTDKWARTYVVNEA